jgi:predicted amidophosphoribosyltransferase
MGLVPIPRVLVRKVRYGSDPAVLLARALGRKSGLPVAQVLTAPVWAKKSAGRSLEGREKRVFFARAVSPRWVLVDDVVTTGGTLSAGALALGGGGLGAVTATVALKQ